MRSFTRVCLELSAVLAVASLTGLTSGWALPLAGLLAVLAGLTVLIEVEERAAADVDPVDEPTPEPEAIAPPPPGPGALVAYRPPGGLAVLSPPVVTATFRLPDVGHATTVCLVGDFNDWSRVAHPMCRVGDAWVASVVVRAGRAYRYRYLVDGTRWENDWAADAYLPNEFGGDDSVLDLRGP